MSNRVNGASWQFGVFGDPLRVLGVKRGDHCGAIVAAFALSTAWANAGLADPLSEVTVRWEAPPGCPDRVALDQELHRDLEGSQAPSIRVRVDASVARLDPETWRVSIRTQSSGGQSERAITAHSCSALVDATSLIIAMLIDPETAATHARPIEGTSESGAVPVATPASSTPAASSNAPTTPPPASNSKRPSAASETKDQNSRAGFIGPVVPNAPTSRWPISGLVALWAAGDSGSLPSFTEALGGSLGLFYGPWRVETSFGYWIPKRNVLDGPPTPGAAGEFGKLAGSVELCLRVWAPSYFAFSPCAGLEVARLSGTGSGTLTEQQTKHLLGASAEVGVLGILSLTDALALRFDLDVLVPLNQPRFGFYDLRGTATTVFTPAWLAVRAGLGVELHFP